MKIVLATGNIGKKKAFDGFFKNLKNIEFLSLKDFSNFGEPEENGKSYTENALIKAKYFAEKTGLPTIAEDSGLELSAFPEKFGLRTKREIEAPNDIEWLRLFLDLLENETDRNGKFVSAMVFYDPRSQKSHSVIGEIEGEIIEFPAAPIEKGIPISAVFRPKGDLDVFSAMTTKRRNEVSHRGYSMAKMKQFLETL